MAILVTGSAGHLGEALLRTFRAQGLTARGLDIVPSPFTAHVGTIEDRTFLRTALADVEAVIHTATLHKPHIATHTAQQFVDTNVTGTLALLEEAVAARVRTFVYTSTTSTFGTALSPATGEPAAWITEDVTPVPKNIYGVTKLAGENLCEMFARTERLPVLVLRTSRFFPEADDNPDRRAAYNLLNMQANELLYRRADIADMVDSHLAALEQAPRLRFGRYIVSATTPFEMADLAQLRTNPAAVVARHYPDFPALYAKAGWRMLPEIDRVYVNARARRDLGWVPKYDFRRALDSLRDGRDFRSPLVGEIGIKGYHGERYRDGLYPIG
jgi:UDP-glucose 4-epimerase